MPECMKVESPMTPTACCSPSLPNALLNPCSPADRSAHAKGTFNRGKRRDCAQGVASDVAQDDAFVFGKGIKHAAVRTSGAHHRGRTAALHPVACFPVRLAQFFRHQILRKFVDHREQIFAETERPSALQCCSMTSSSSSTTTRRSTFAAKSKIRCTGSG